MIIFKNQRVLGRHHPASGEDSMSDTQKKDPQSRPTAPSGDEDIIDLVEEIQEEGPQRPLSPLERQLLDFGDQTFAADRAAIDLPDLGDLGRIDFDEEDDEEKGGSDGRPAPVAAQRSAEGGPSTEAGGNEIEEISEFDEQLLDAADILEVEDLLSGPPSAGKKPEPEEDEGLELIDVEEDEADDEIVWFDDLDKEAPPPAPVTADASQEAPLPDWDTASGQDTSAADVFAAHVESALPETDMGPALAAAEAGAATAAAAAAAAVFQPPAESAPRLPPPAAEDASPAALPGLSPAEIEAAVERVIERKLGATIESIIQQAIENAVSKEIERLKRLLLEDDDRGADA
jgi:hypothetical protein